MGLEATINKPLDLNPLWPLGTEDKNEGDDHIRNIKQAIRLLALSALGGSGASGIALTGETIVPVSSLLRILPAGTATSGQLTYISSAAYDGSVILIVAGDPTRPVTVMHNTSGTGRIELKDATNFRLDDIDRCLLLRKNFSEWREICRFDSVAQPFGVRAYASAEGLIGTGVDAATLTHGLGARPTLVRYVLVCKSTALGYSVGDESGSVGGISVWANATQVGWVTDVTPTLRHKTTGITTTIVPSNWRWKMHAWL